MERDVYVRYAPANVVQTGEDTYIRSNHLLGEALFSNHTTQSLDRAHTNLQEEMTWPL